MANQDIINRFEKSASRTRLYEYIKHTKNVLLYPTLPQTKLKSALKIYTDETILMIYINESTGWNTIITDFRIYNIIISEEFTKVAKTILNTLTISFPAGFLLKKMLSNTQESTISFNITWEDIKIVEASNDKIYFTMKSNKITIIPISQFLPKPKRYDNTCINALIKGFNDILGINNNKDAENEFNEILNISENTNKKIDTYNKQLNDPNNIPDSQLYEKTIQNDIEKIQKFILNEENSKTNIAIACSKLANIYIEFNKDYDNAMTFCDKGLKLCDINNKEEYIADLYFTKSIYYQHLSDYKSGRKYGVEALNRTNDFIKKQKIENIIGKIDEEYIQKFLELPYAKRKLIMPVREYVDLSQENITVLDINSISSLNFPMGHPIANELYVGHPLIPRKYIPLADYKLELIEDKVREFCELAQSLGATEISIECLNDEKHDDNRRKGTNVDAMGKIPQGEGETNVEFKKENKLVNELEKRINLHQTFTPEKDPHIPNGLVWYNYEASWQRLVRQRMNGNLNKHTEKISTRNSSLIESQELISVKAEVKNLSFKMGVNVNHEDESKYHQEDNAELIINVTFASKNETMKNRDSKHSYTDAESNYLNMVKIALQDGIISPDERLMLNAISESSGISQKRAEELEQSLTPQLSDDEKYYLNMYQQLLKANEGEITETTKIMLNELRKMKNISEARAQEIENMAN